MGRPVASRRMLAIGPAAITVKSVAGKSRGICARVGLCPTYAGLFHSHPLSTMDEPIDQAVAAIISWARQTVVFAICRRGQATGLSVDSPEKMTAIADEAAEVVGKLWESARRECRNPHDVGEHTMKLAGKVLSWCSEHRYGV